MYQKGCKTLSLFHFRIYFSASSTTTLAKENAVASNLKEEIYGCCSLAYTCLYIFRSKTFFLQRFLLSPSTRNYVFKLFFFGMDLYAHHESDQPYVNTLNYNIWMKNILLKGKCLNKFVTSMHIYVYVHPATLAMVWWLFHHFNHGIWNSYIAIYFELFWYYTLLWLAVPYLTLSCFVLPCLTLPLPSLFACWLMDSYNRLNMCVCCLEQNRTKSKTAKW